MRTFQINAQHFTANDCQRGVLIDPVLPIGFMGTPNIERPHAHMIWWGMPYVETDSKESFSVWCLDGGAWDRPTWRGKAETLAAALELARKVRQSPMVYELRPLDGQHGSFSATPMTTD